MSRKSSIRLVLGHDGHPSHTRPPMHQSSFSLTGLKTLGKSALDNTLLDSSMAIVDEDEQSATLAARSGKLPLISRTKHVFSDADTGIRPVVLKRRTPDFTVKNLRISISLSKGKRSFAGLIPFGGLRKLDDILPVHRWKKAHPIAVAVLPAEPGSAKRDPLPINGGTLLVSPSESPLRPVRRPSKCKELTKLGQSFDQGMLATSESAWELPSAGVCLPRGSFSFCEEFDKEVDTKGAYPYLAMELRKPRASRVLQPQQLPTPQTKRKEEKSGLSSCTCSLKLYLTASLHYQQLFLRATPSNASLQQLPSLTPLYVSSTEWESHRLVVTIVFDGVLGDWSKRCLTDQSAFFLRVRKDAAAGLALLQQNFRLVFVSRMPKKLCMHALAYFRNRGVYFEAAYRLSTRANTPESRFHQFLSYEKIEKDLALVRPARCMLVLSSLNLSQEELLPPSPELLYTKRGTRFSLTADYLPVAVPTNDGVPVTCLVPGLQSQENGAVLSFDEVARALLSLHSKGEDWVTGFYSEREHPDLFRFSTSAVHQVLMSHILPEPRSDCFLSQSLPSHTCNLHSRLAWGKGPSIHPFTSRLMLLMAQALGDDSPGFEIIETKTQVLRSGYVNLLDYVLCSGLKACLQ